MTFEINCTFLHSSFRGKTNIFSDKNMGKKCTSLLEMICQKEIRTKKVSSQRNCWFSSANFSYFRLRSKMAPVGRCAHVRFQTSRLCTSKKAQFSSKIHFPCLSCPQNYTRYLSDYVWCLSAAKQNVFSTQNSKNKLFFCEQNVSAATWS